MILADLPALNLAHQDTSATGGAIFRVFEDFVKPNYRLITVGRDMPIIGDVGPALALIEIGRGIGSRELALGL